MKSATRPKITRMLRKGIRQKDIAARLHVSAAYVSKVNRNLTEKLTDLTKKSTIGSRIPQPQPTPSQAEGPKLMLRLHRLPRLYSIQNAVSEARLAGLKPLGMNNNMQYLGDGFRITTQHLELEGIRLVASRLTPAGVVRAVAIQLADVAAGAIAAQYGLKIDIPGATSPPNMIEIELTEHEMAERVQDKGIIPLHYDGSTREPDVWMDKSFGMGGLESNVVPYIQKLTDMTNDIVDRDAWEQMKANLLQTTELVRYYAKNMEAHAKLVRQAGSLIKELRKERKRKEGKAEAPAQRRLFRDGA